MSLVTMSLVTMSLATMALATMPFATMSLVNIVPRNNYSSLTLRMVICNEDGPPDDQNQKDGRARSVANDHLDDFTSSVLLHSFANGHLQRGRSSR